MTQNTDELEAPLDVNTRHMLALNDGVYNDMPRVVADYRALIDAITALRPDAEALRAIESHHFTVEWRAVDLWYVSGAVSPDLRCAVQAAIQQATERGE